MDGIDTSNSFLPTARPGKRMNGDARPREGDMNVLGESLHGGLQDSLGLRHPATIHFGLRGAGITEGMIGKAGA